ncbi:U3 small nucleolar RNA-associated protein 6 homolog [Anopheles maculipalpis]|uniref:U3 small nucleolar RNA-associated protein 6 homolog n=1 Tax=Anopheles maculipalpis TaxID=1496333 RepID=UPI002159A24A|nr:U3 small nucleolar RNA-associated protein 6 homolog [Anopheles maculipalpis]
MSELIELRREQAIREYECMKHLKLFTDEEIQSIKNKRHYHDYKIERRTKSLADFINYIAYECNLFQLLLQRRRRLRIRAEWVSLEKSIHNRVRVLYKRAMHRFASDYRVWIHFLRYCKTRRFFTEGSAVLDQMLGYHGDKPKAWLCAIDWEYLQAKNMTRAKHYTLRGLQRHPECRELCVNFITIQLAEAKRIGKKSEKEEKNVPVGDDAELEKALKTAHLVYKNFEHKDMAFYEELLKVFKKYVPVSNELAKEAIAEMRNILADKEEMWHLLANLMLEGSEFVTEGAIKSSEALEKCLEIYEEALDRLPTKKMHSFCIDAMLELNSTQDETVGVQKSKRKALANAFKRALVADLLEEKKLLQYLKLLLHNNNPKEELIMSVIGKGLEQYPASVKIWQSYMRYLMVHKDVEEDELEAVFRKGVSSLPEKSNRLPLWEMLFHYYSNRPDLPGKLEQLFRRAIDQGPEISHHYQPLFLDYIMSKSSIAKARSEYQRLVKNYTTTLELHQKMANLEATQTPPDVNEWRQCHENATQFYGKTDPTVWLQYAQFERDHGKPQHMQSLYERAKAALDEESFATFMAEYELIRNPYIVRY